MSKAVRLGIWVLAVLVVVSAAVAVLTLMQKQTLEGQNQGLRSQISEDQAKASELLAKVKKLQDDADQLNNRISQTEQEKTQIQSLSDELKRKSDDLQSQVDQANADRDDWKNRVTTITRERDDLMQKLKDRPTIIKTVYKERPAPAAPAVDMTSAQGDQYWGSVLKQKAALQLALEKAKSDLDQVALQVVELKKEKSDLELQVKQVTNEKDELTQKVKFGGDLADTLSVEVARSRSDQKEVNDRADKLKAENLELQSQIRDLTSTKVALERTISRLTDDKDAMQKKLVETESVIQGRIDEIWKIKESLDKKLSQNPLSPSASTGNMELPPIIVNAPSGNQAPMASAPSAGKITGSIISINTANNFVITDLGQENSPVSVGQALKVYRGSREIAALEVIQVRRDICAADIKDKSTDLKVGDTVKFS